MKTTLRYAAFAVFFALLTLPVQMYAKASTSAAATAKKEAPTTYTVNFNANGGNGKMSTQKFTVNKAANLAANRFTRGGHVFAGWSTSKTGAVNYQNGQSVKNLAAGGKTVTLYARWAVQNYLVAFYANGGSGSMPVQKHAYGKAANLSPSRFTRKGYSFAGWATKPQGQVTFKDKASVKNLTQAGRTIQLYAVWQANETYTVNFDANGGSGSMSAQTFAVGKSANLSANRFTRSGYVFNGWSTSKAGPVNYQNGQAVKNLAARGKTVTLYAQWAVQDYLVAFYANGGTGSMSVQKHTYGKAANLTPNRFTRAGHSFSGWATKPQGLVTFKDGASVKNLTQAGRTIQLYAVWKADAVTPSLPDDQVDFAQLKWVYGGFNGASAKISGKARISGLNASNSGVAYSWASGGCQDLGASSASDANCLACLFCYADGKWTGGKFDWICTNNKAPSFKNIIDKYNGWSSAVLSKATEYAFVIVSRDGKSRTNVIRVKSPGASDPTPPTPPAATPSLPDDQVDYAQLKWIYGGFNGALAKTSDKARISNLNASNSGVAYSWASGGCQDLGASSASDANCLACLFCYADGKWTGGKFDWICTNNKTPSFKNIIDKYNGWSSAVLSKATEYAFVIVSRDGKSRTNVIRVKSPGFSTPTPATDPSPTPTPSTPTPTPSTDASSADEVNFSLLQWTYGGFKGEQAKLGAQPRITGLNVNNSGMSYSWRSGGCENLGATSSSDYSHTVACLFCYYGGKWVGGKFDWVSTSRRSRDFKNVHEGYNGWSPTAFSRAEAYAFVIVSKDGKSRSNVIRCGK